MSGKTAGRALKAAISGGILGSPSLVYEPGSPKHAALFYDLEEFEAGLDRAKDAFGKGNDEIYLALINRVGGLYGRILTEVVSTDRTQ